MKNLLTCSISMIRGITLWITCTKVIRFPKPHKCFPIKTSLFMLLLI